MDYKDITPSHILVFVDKRLPEEDVSTFCTNLASENPGIGFTYLSYDNPLTETDKISGSIPCDPADYNRIFAVSDSSYAIGILQNMGIACAALLTGYNGADDFKDVLYLLENIEYTGFDVIDRMWKRHHDIPWTIAVTERLIIREQTLSDIPALYEIYDDEDSVRYMEDLYEDPKEEEKYLRDYIDHQYRFCEFGIWAIVRRSDHKLIGRAGISMREGFDQPEAGYIIGKPYRRMGYATEAMRAIIDYAREELCMSEMIAFTKKRNAASVGLLRTLGFTEKGFAYIKGGHHAMYILTKQR